MKFPPCKVEVVVSFCVLCTYAVLLVYACKTCIMLSAKICSLYVGALCISEVLWDSLQVLNLSLNGIGDDGIIGITEARHICCLYVITCGITLTGARALGEGIQINNSVRTLDVRDNSITVEGAQLILQSAVDNGVCQEVVIDSDYKSDDEVVKTMVILEQRKKQEVMVLQRVWWLCCECFTVKGVTTK